MASPVAKPELVLWLPPWRRLREQIATVPAFARLAARADRSDAEPGDDARLKEAFDVLPRPNPQHGFPVAALTRELDSGDALISAWVRADPGFLRPDMASARLLACGDLGLTQSEADEYIKPLRTIFGDMGVMISAPTPSRWYVEISKETRLPAFSPPDKVLGDDLFQHLPEGDAGRRWKHLLNEAQTVLHNHPLNAERIRAGKLPVNTLWFWGGGSLPDSVRLNKNVRFMYSKDLLVQALAKRVPVDCAPPQSFPVARATAGTIVDLRDADDAALVFERNIEPLMQRQKRAGFALALQFADGLRLRWEPSMKWRFWRSKLPE